MAAGLTLAACSRDREPLPEPLAPTICVNTLATDGAGTSPADNTFMALFWQSCTHLAGPNASDPLQTWTPYLASHAPQPVAYYTSMLYDTGYPYPRGESSVLYATGYAPGVLLRPDPAAGFRRLIATEGSQPMSGEQASRCDFLGCDLWKEVWWGSVDYPFSQESNKLYFRHLAAKLLFYADRDRPSMEGKQFVRNVEITKLSMSIDGGLTWTPMHTPLEFEWQELPSSYFDTGTLNQMVETLSGKQTEKNTSWVSGTPTRPTHGYRAVISGTFAGAESDYLLSKRVTDRVPIEGQSIDSCYVCNELDGSGTPKKNQPIRLRMTIRAEMSYDFNFSKGDGDIGTGSGSTTDDLTFTREWNNLMVEIKPKDEGSTETITEFEPGREYRVYIHFSRSGVNLVAWKMKWDFGGSHNVVIQGGEQPEGEQPTNPTVVAGTVVAADGVNFGDETQD